MTERKQVPKPLIGKNTVTPMDVLAKAISVIKAACAE